MKYDKVLPRQATVKFDCANRSKRLRNLHSKASRIGVFSSNKDTFSTSSPAEPFPFAILLLVLFCWCFSYSVTRVSPLHTYIVSVRLGRLLYAMFPLLFLPTVFFFFFLFLFCNLLKRSHMSFELHSLPSRQKSCFDLIINDDDRRSKYFLTIPE